MREGIAAELAAIESELGCRVLYACESGSRAWGFASPDSDYDIRFIYAHPAAWHMRLEQRRDTFERMAPGDLDISGWELGKMLRLFAGCNLALNEWLDSPDVYQELPGFAAQARDLIPRYFNPQKGLHHYLSMAGNVAREHLTGSRIGIKKAFYVLRPMLACRWIVERRTMPPTLFSSLLEQPLSASLEDEIAALLVRKADAAEGERIDLSRSLTDWIASSQADLKEASKEIKWTPKPDWEPLNAIMTKWSENI